MPISLRSATAAAVFILLLAVAATSHAFISLPDLWSTFSAGDKKTIDELEKKQDWNGMHELARKRLGANDTDAAWQYVDGFALQRLGRCSEAIPRFRLVLIVKPEVKDAQNELGRCLLADGQLDAARSTFAGLIGNSPHYWQAYYNLALVYVRKQDVFNARIYLEQLRSRNRKMAAEIEESEINPLEARLEQERIGEANRKNEEKARVERERVARERELLAREVDEARAKAVIPAAALEAKLLPSEPPIAAAPAKSVDERLKELKRLYAKKLITKDAYGARQKELLNQQ